MRQALAARWRGDAGLQRHRDAGGVELHQLLAGIGSRFFADFIDTFVIIGIYVVLAIMLMFTPAWEKVSALAAGTVVIAEGSRD